MNDSKEEKDLSTEKKLEKKLEIAAKEARKSAIHDKKIIEALTFTDPEAFDPDGKKEPGEDNWKKYGFDLHPHVSFFSCAVLTVCIMLVLMFRVHADEFFSNVLEIITSNAGWFLILSVNIMIIAIVYFALSSFGKIRLGGNKAKPEFSTLSWLAMLLSAGMGIGLMFWSVGEPILHYGSPSPIFDGVEGSTPKAAQAAMSTTFFHWGVHPWAVYALVGLGLAFFTFNRGLPLTIRSIFYPLLGNKIYGFWGNLIDILAVLATLAGLATSLGLGSQQVNAGLNALFGITISTTNQVILIIIITAMATASVVSGLEKGVKMLSQLNMIVAGIFLVFMLAVGSTTSLLGGLTQNIGNYIKHLPEMSFWTETFSETNWQGTWTVFYWAWWISWSPFVGMFIARISKGRTVREFVAGVILVPTILSFIWMSVFGQAAINLQSSGVADIATAINIDVSTALFEMLEFFPWTSLLSFVGIILVTIFFVTSSDSGSLVVNHLTSGGKLMFPTFQRVFWASMEGLLAIVLLLGGGLETLKTASVSTGLPFALVLLLTIYSLYIGFTQELIANEKVKQTVTELKTEHTLKETIEEVVNNNEE
ncbi:MAG: BCCT family transporter [Candidatus Muiribacteriota bacterium]